MIRRNTWIVLVLLAVVVGFAFYFNDRKAKQEASATPTTAAVEAKTLFSAAEGDPTGIKIENSTGELVELDRNESGVWVLQAPTSAAADQAAAQAAATQLTALRVLSTVQLDLPIVGLDNPSYTITVTFSGSKAHVLKVGAITPVQDGYYTSLDRGPIQIVDKQGLDALVLLLAQPPYAATLTPSPQATIEAPTVGIPAVPTDTPGGTAIPGGSDTPAPSQPPTVSPTP